MAASGAEDLGGFLAALRSLNGGYGTHLPQEMGVTPFGAYGMLLENWDQWSEEAGFGGADFRDPAAQDAVAGFWSTKFFNRYGSWEMVANAWYAGQDQTDALVSQGLRAFTNDRIRSYTEAVMAAQEQMAGTAAAGVPAAARQWINASSGNVWLNPVAGNSQYTNSYNVARPGTKSGIHGAIDMYAKRGTPIVSPVAGTVRSAKVNSGAGGNWVQVMGNDGNLYYFAHMEGSPTVKRGDTVRAGSALGYVGNSGSARGTTPHLHFKVSRNGVTQNPYGLLQGSSGADGYFRAQNANIPLEAGNTRMPDGRAGINTMIQQISNEVAGGDRVDYRTLGIDEDTEDGIDIKVTPGGTAL
ncbi:MAG: hypothetical protein DRQ39_00840 [Gammaproteobacteria bacterium]|nr:MAG: hypothetical protein DRQ39_00840 [Gammaproteobacteria bacterium]RKZ96177.1 MAG: hypothetical protein DRQ40_01705 [Gammaproteobacteria bacterium]